jgi:hypothetical protein
MATNSDTRPHKPRLLRSKLFATCKFWLALSLIAKIFGFFVGVLSVWFSVLPDTTPYIVAISIAFSEFAMWWSDCVRDIAESLHRKLDYENAFGWAITNAEMSDLLARVRCDLGELKNDQQTGSDYFASAHEPSSLRAAENLQESSWWSKHLAGSMWIICLILMVLLVASSIVLLIVSINMVKDFAVLSNVGNVVTSVILLIFSLGLLPFTVKYFSFARVAEKAEESAKLLAESGNVDQVSILKLWQEYQLARATTPILPTWICTIRQKRLNELWKLYRV